MRLRQRDAGDLIPISAARDCAERNLTAVKPVPVVRFYI